MDFLIVGIFVAALGTVVLLIKVAFMTAESNEHRKLAFQAMAAQKNLHYQSHGSCYAEFLADFALMSRDRGNYVNSVTGKHQDLDVAMADYFYGDTDTDTTQTVLMIHSDMFDLPRFAIVPKQSFGLLRSLVWPGCRQFDFAKDSEFSNAFVFKTDNESEVIGLFNNQTLRRSFVTAGHVTCEVRGGTFIWYRHGKKIPSELLDRFLAEGVAAFQKVAESASR